jgi:hypothetical protein
MAVERTEGLRGDIGSWNGKGLKRKQRAVERTEGCRGGQMVIEGIKGR